LKIIISFLFIIISLEVKGGVNLENGSYFHRFNILSDSDKELALDLTVTYNSRIVYNGYFGFAMGSFIETKLIASPDGSVTIYENGSGKRSYYIPVDVKIDPAKGAEKIIQELEKNTPITGKSRTDYFNKLKNNANLRTEMVKKLNLKTKIANKTNFKSKVHGEGHLTKTAKGWVRVSSKGVSSYFNDDGFLTKIHDSNGLTISLIYSNTKLESIQSSKGSSFNFEWILNKRIKRIRSSDGVNVSFDYDKNGDLIHIKKIKGDYALKYDGNHNLVEIKDFYGKETKITYAKKSQFVSQIKGPKGKVKRYTFGRDKKAKNHFWTLVKTKEGKKDWIDEKYEFYQQLNDDGSKFTNKIIHSKFGIQTERSFDPCCYLPVKIKRGNHVTHFEYNSDGRLLKKWSSRGDKVLLEYNKKNKKLMKVKNNNEWTSFKYDNKGNLQKIQNSRGEVALLVYNIKNRIVKILYQDKKSKDSKKDQYRFEYDVKGRPIKIGVDEIGKMKVFYDNTGNLKKLHGNKQASIMEKSIDAYDILSRLVGPAMVYPNRIQ
jgi:YD repeat-containing protein